MTRLVHTADVHLRSDADERRRGLESVLSLAAEREVDVVTIGGDLFDRPEDLERLREPLRNDLFTDLPFEVLVIPGNHDVEAFRTDLFFGDACTVMTTGDEPFATWTAPGGDLRVVGLPYQETATDDLLLTIEERPAFDGTDALLFHGSLDAPLNADAGDEDSYRYFPISEEALTTLGFDYYLAGHYHGRHHLHFESGGEFAYPGTPSSTRRSETGRRQAVTLDTGANGGLSFEPLDSFHYLEQEVTVAPGEEDAAVETVREWVEGSVTPAAEATVIVDGLVDAPEDAFAARLREAAGPAAVTNRTTSVAAVVDHPVIQAFEERLADRDWDDDTREAVRDRLLRAASEVHSTGGLR
jgi:DNA repair exonuclease SbcCD nuclease subunit